MKFREYIAEKQDILKDMRKAFKEKHTVKKDTMTLGSDKRYTAKKIDSYHITVTSKLFKGSSESNAGEMEDGVLDMNRFNSTFDQLMDAFKD